MIGTTTAVEPAPPLGLAPAGWPRDSGAIPVRSLAGGDAGESAPMPHFADGSRFAAARLRFDLRLLSVAAAVVLTCAAGCAPGEPATVTSADAASGTGGRSSDAASDAAPPTGGFGSGGALGAGSGGTTGRTGGTDGGLQDGSGGSPGGTGGATGAGGTVTAGSGGATPAGSGGAGGGGGRTQSGSGGSVGTGGAGAGGRGGSAVGGAGGGAPRVGVALFNGVNLDGWVANPVYWSVIDGAITGKYSGNTSGSFAMTKDDYTDFRVIVTMRKVISDNHLGIGFWQPRPAGFGFYNCMLVIPPADGIWDYTVKPSPGAFTPITHVAQVNINQTKWYTMEVLANFKTGTVRVAANGVEVLRYQNPAHAPYTKGPIALQLHGFNGAQEAQYKDVYVESPPAEDRLITVR